MKQISNKEYEKYQQYQTDTLHGRILTQDGLRVICAGLDNDPEKIGIHMLEMLAKFRREGVICSKAHTGQRRAPFQEPAQLLAFTKLSAHMV
jgi:hypothetical protein